MWTCETHNSYHQQEDYNYTENEYIPGRMFHIKYRRILRSYFFRISIKFLKKSKRMKSNILKWTQIFLKYLKCFRQELVYFMNSSKNLISRLFEELSSPLITSNEKYISQRIHVVNDCHMKPTKNYIFSQYNYHISLRICDIIERELEIRCFFPVIDLHKERKRLNVPVLKADADEVRKLDQEYSNNATNAHLLSLIVLHGYFFSVSMEIDLLFWLWVVLYHLVIDSKKYSD